MLLSLFFFFSFPSLLHLCPHMLTLLDGRTNTILSTGSQPWLWVLADISSHVVAEEQVGNMTQSGVIYSIITMTIRWRKRKRNTHTVLIHSYLLSVLTTNRSSFSFSFFFFKCLYISVKNNGTRQAAGRNQLISSPLRTHRLVIWMHFASQTLCLQDAYTGLDPCSLDHNDRQCFRGTYRQETHQTSPHENYNSS